jgi:hypothetical protein
LAGCCECGDEPSGSGATELVKSYICIRSYRSCYKFICIMFIIKPTYFDNVKFARYNLEIKDCKDVLNYEHMYIAACDICRYVYEL